MKTIQTSRNVQTTITVVSATQTNSSTVTVVYRLQELSLIGARQLGDPKQGRFLIQDRPEEVLPQFDEEGSETGSTTIPAVTDLTDFFADKTTPTEIWEGYEEKAMDHANLEEWDESIIDDIANDPEADTIKPWQPNELVAPPNRRAYGGKVYGVIQSHTTQADWTPDITPALWNFLFDEGGENERPEWVAPTGAHDAYNTGDEVQHDGKCWKSNIYANTTVPGENESFNWWEEIPCD